MNSKPRKSSLAFLGLLLTGLLFPSCLPERKSASKNPFAVPAQPDVPGNNLPAKTRAELGRMLFFDPLLSGSNARACVDCHRPGLGWADGSKRPRLENGAPGSAHVPSLFNIGFVREHYRGGKKKTLEELAALAIVSPGQMNQNPEELVRELGANEHYRYLIKRSYALRRLDIKTVSLALANYMRTIISRDSSFDRWQEGDKNAIGDSAKQGFRIFKGKAGCLQCHSGFNFSDGKRRPSTNGRLVRTPSLRDIALSSPYMHDGSRKNLHEVLDSHPAAFRSSKKAALTSEEKRLVIKFLITLSGKKNPHAYPVLPRIH